MFLFIILLPFVWSIEPPRGVVNMVHGVKVTSYNVTVTSYNVDLILPCRYSTFGLREHEFVLTWKVSDDWSDDEILYHIVNRKVLKRDVVGIKNVTLVDRDLYDGNVDLRLRIDRSSRMRMYTCITVAASIIGYTKTLVYGMYGIRIHLFYIPDCYLYSL